MVLDVSRLQAATRESTTKTERKKASTFGRPSPIQLTTFWCGDSCLQNLEKHVCQTLGVDADPSTRSFLPVLDYRNPDSYQEGETLKSQIKTGTF